MKSHRTIADELEQVEMGIGWMLAQIASGRIGITKATFTQEYREDVGRHASTLRSIVNRLQLADLLDIHEPRTDDEIVEIVSKARSIIARYGKENTISEEANSTKNR